MCSLGESSYVGLLTAEVRLGLVLVLDRGAVGACRRQGVKLHTPLQRIQGVHYLHKTIHPVYN